jgi:hypothetical protein
MLEVPSQTKGVEKVNVGNTVPLNVMDGFVYTDVIGVVSNVVPENADKAV